MSRFLKSKEDLIKTKLESLIKNGLTAKEISESLNISKTTVHRYCKKLNIKIPNYHNMLKFDNTVFDIIDTEEKAYWLGFLYADGNVGTNSNIVSISLSRKDIEHLNKFNKFLKNTANVRKTITRTNNRDYETCNIAVCDKHLKEQLISLGCCPKKSLILKFPKREIFEKENLIYDFIRGYVDGDGCLTFSRNGRLALNIVGTYEFLQGIVDIFPQQFTKVRKLKRLKTNVYTIGNCGTNADYVTKILYENANIYLQRKYDRFAVLCRNT